MTQIRSDYYDRFSCTADQCPITCCQEWKISVDEHTNKCWKKLAPPANTIPAKTRLSAYTTFKDGTRVIALNQDHRCPFLSKEKLCKLVLEHGDQVLSETCQVFPRETHTFDTHEEQSLMPCCPAVIDLWKDCETLHFPEVSDQWFQTESDRNSAALDGSSDDVSDALLFQLRSKLIALMQRSDRTPSQALMESFYILLELYRNDDWNEETLNDYFSESTLTELHKAIFSASQAPEDTIIEDNEILQDLAVNYQKEGLYQSYLNPILADAEALAEDYGTETLTRQWETFLQSLKGFHPLLKNVLANELFSDLLIPGGDLENMLVQMQWMALEYAAVRQSLFLLWLQNGGQELTYEQVRDYLVILMRMTGYDEDDIYEYLENSFEELVWEWGYFALVVC